MKKHHPFHLTSNSPWPLLIAIRAFFLTSGLVNWFRKGRSRIIWISLLVIILRMFQWWRDVIREGLYQGIHTTEVLKGLKIGIILFITSEVLFFFSFFWAFFHRRLVPIFELGGVWPPTGVIPFNPFQIPLLNTIILLSSGASVTWAHHALLRREYKSSIYSLTLTVGLGIYFTYLQGFEYIRATFSIADSVYGSVFFVATGFHGFHVIIGTIFLIVCLIRRWGGHFSSDHHFGFEAAAWYWHFVDVVWLFLFVSIYWWGR